MITIKERLRAAIQEYSAARDAVPPLTLLLGAALETSERAVLDRYHAAREAIEQLAVAWYEANAERSAPYGIRISLKGKWQVSDEAALAQWLRDEGHSATGYLNSKDRKDLFRKLELSKQLPPSVTYVYTPRAQVPVIFPICERCVMPFDTGEQYLHIVARVIGGEQRGSERDIHAGCMDEGEQAAAQLHNLQAALRRLLPHVDSVREAMAIGEVPPLNANDSRIGGSGRRGVVAVRHHHAP